MNTEEVSFEVGDEVIITKSKKNWNEEKMDKFDNKIVIITKIFYNTIKFENCEGWLWRYSDGHFKLHKKADPLIEENYNYLIPILKKLNIK